MGAMAASVIIGLVVILGVESGSLSFGRKLVPERLHIGNEKAVSPSVIFLPCLKI